MAWPPGTEAANQTETGRIWPPIGASGGADPTWQEYLPHDGMTESDPNSIASAALAPGGGASRITMANAGVIRNTPDVGAAWRAGLKDITGAALALKVGDVIDLAVRMAATLPTDMAVFAIVYDGNNGADAPSATDIGAGVVLIDDAGITTNVLRSTGAGWTRGVDSTPGQVNGRIGRLMVGSGNSANASQLTSFLGDAANIKLEGGNNNNANVAFGGVVDTFAVGVLWEGIGGSNGVTLDIAGLAACWASTGAPLVS